MKKCPQCGREYDPSMMFCLDDGAELLYGPGSNDEPATAVFGVPPSDGESTTRSYDRTTTAEAEPPTTLGASTERQGLSTHRAAQPQEVFESSAEEQSFSAHRAAKPMQRA